MQGHPLYSQNNLVMAQNHMKQRADQGHSKCEFVEVDQMFLCLQYYNNISLKSQHYQNISPKFYGPYCILKRVGFVA
jgi:hypothetical protein